MVSVPAGDAFALIFDLLSSDCEGAQQLEDWSASPEYRDATSWVDRAVAVSGGQVVVPSALWENPVLPTHRLGVLKGLDMLLTQAANVRTPAVGPHIPLLQAHYRRQGRFNVNEPGMVVPRRVSRGRLQLRAETISDSMNTLRISDQSAAQCVWVRVPADLDYPPVPLLKVGQVPLALPEDLRRTANASASGIPVYVLTPDQDRLRAKVDQAVAGLAGFDLGIVAEATLSTDLLADWQRALTSAAPRWTLVGTGPVELSSAPGISAPRRARPFHDGTRVPVNRAVLLHSSGVIIAVADKRRGYSIGADALGSYGLPEDGQLRDEGIRAGTRLVIVESNVGRFTVLVCEDLDRLLEFGSLLREVGVSHVLNPVVAPQLREHRWQHKDGKALRDDLGARLITANSLAIQRFCTDDSGAVLPSFGVPTLLVVDGAEFKLVRNPAASRQTPEQDSVTVRDASVSSAPLP